jgi:hypothetical protein
MSHPQQSFAGIAIAGSDFAISTSSERINFPQILTLVGFCGGCRSALGADPAAGALWSSLSQSHEIRDRRVNHVIAHLLSAAGEAG